MLPLAITMCLNVLLMNLSLTYSSITFYQMTRILLSPAVTAIKFLFLQDEDSQSVTLGLMSLGVGIISFYEPRGTVAIEGNRDYSCLRRRAR